jgi:hypothetical protein
MNVCRRSSLTNKEKNAAIAEQHGKTIKPYIYLISVNLSVTNARMKPIVYEAINKKPTMTGSSNGYVTSFANAIPTGMIGIKNNAPITKLIEIAHLLPITNSTMLNNSKKVVAKQYTLVCNKNLLYLLSKMPDVIDASTPASTTKMPSSDI